MRSRTLTAIENARPDSLALCDHERQLSYGDLRTAVTSDGDWILANRIGRCGLLSDNGAAWVIADLALLANGTLAVPLPTSFTADQIAHALDDAGIDSVLTDTPERVLSARNEFSTIARAPHSGLMLLQRNVARPIEIPADTAKITYTSGSTGTPKGVCLTLTAMEQVVDSIVQSSPNGIARHLCLMPLATLLENLAGVYAPLQLGATCVAPSSQATGIGYGGINHAALLAAISTQRPNSLILVPELLRLLVAAVHRGWAPPPELKFIAVGGAAVAPALVDEARSLGLPAFEGYGLSECASVVCLNTPSASKAGSVGKPLPHARVRIDARGHIVVSGATMRGYLGNSTGAQDEIDTGDLGSIDADGFVYVRGRAKNMFITSMGRNVSPEWVEAELLRDENIAQAVVCGEARPYPIALITPSSAHITDQCIDAAVAAANARLPSYAQVYRWTRLPAPLCYADGLLTANGRPRRDVIAQRYASLIDSLFLTALAS